MREATTIPSTHRQPVHPERPSALDLILQRKAPVQMSNGVVAMGIGANWSHHSKPEAAIPLEHQHRLRRPLAMGLQKRHAELLSHFRPLRPLTKPAQQRVHLGKRNERGESVTRIKPSNHCTSWSSSSIVGSMAGKGNAKKPNP